MPITSPRPRRATGALVLAALLTVSTALPAAADTSDPTTGAAPAAGWLAAQLVDGERIEGGFGPDAGLTADVVLALAASGLGADRIDAAAAWLATQAPGYTRGVPFEEEPAVYAGATAKLALTLEVAGLDPRDAAGDDLVAQLLDREQGSGRFTDVSGFGEFSSALTQSLAVLALARIDDTDPSDAAVSFLLEQVCDDGGVRFSPDADDCESSVDTTGLAVQALTAAATPDALAAAEAAGGWLVAVQAPDGSFAADGVANANSTGLAAAALDLLPDLDGAAEAADAARSFLLGLQRTCDEALPGAIVFSADDAGDPARATAQALLGLTSAELATITARGAAADAAVLLPFPDVTPGSAHAGAVCRLAATGVISGRADGSFGGRDHVTRGQAASMLAAALGLEQIDDGRFADAPPGATHAGAIGALAEAGILRGLGDGTVGRAAPLRRDQAASLLAAAFELDLAGDAPGFDDVTAGNVHAPAISALAAAGVVSGFADGTFGPERTVTRDQLASLLDGLSSPHHAG